MTLVAATVAILLPCTAACATWTSTRSLYRSPCVHVGVRPASTCGPAGCDGVGATVQVSTDAPVCREVYPHE